jgi:MSHA biogenesis protein MshM
MYLEHFGLHEYPFGLTPDTSYFFPGVGAQAALNTVLVALENGEGLIKIVGEPGSGKTILCRYLLNRMEGIPNPNLSSAALTQALLNEFGGGFRRSLTYGLTKALEVRLLELAHEGKRAVALIDEAQAMPIESLEALRLITNLETEKSKLLQIVLFGQPELDDKLADPSVRQIRSRIAFHDHITPINAGELPAYLGYRLNRAGAARPLFTAAAMSKLHKMSRGLPRYINILAHKALMLAFGEGRHEVDVRHVRLAGKDTPGVRLSLWDRLR